MRSRLALMMTHLVGDAILVSVGYWWLGTSESDAAHLLLSALSVLFFLVAATWLQGLALASFFGLSYSQAGARAMRNLLPLLALVLLAVLIYGLLWWIGLHDGHTAFVIGSYTTMTTRKPVAPTAIVRFFGFVITFLRWVVVPALIFPLAAAISFRGWRGWKMRSLRSKRAWLYWLEVGVLLFCAIWVPFRLFFWIPTIESFGGQMASLILRLGIGYLLFVGGVLTVEYLSSKAITDTADWKMVDPPYN